MLLFFDIDGTIFDDERRLPASVKPAMAAARKNGHRLVNFLIHIFSGN